MMLKLREYNAFDAEVITKWISNEYYFSQCSADRYEKYPITAYDMNSYYEREKINNQIYIMTAYDENGIIGHFTLRFVDDDRKTIRLGFVIIDNSKRKKGYGKQMIDLAIKYAFDNIGVNKISLGVFENNGDAIKCYKNCGFKEVKTEIVESYACMGEIWNCIEMENSKEV